MTEAFSKAVPDVAETVKSLQADILKFGQHTASCAWSMRGGACNCGWLDVSRAARAFQGEK